MSVNIARQLATHSRTWTHKLRSFAFRCSKTIMATLKRSDSWTLKEDTPPRSCIACTDTDVPLLKPCRTCSTDYCEECLTGMFVDAIRDKTRMPPRCCCLIQIHTVVDILQEDELKNYRAEFEEWIAPKKVYCPALKCSAFIPERRLPIVQTTPASTTVSLTSVLETIFEALDQSPAARFFRADAPIDVLPGYTDVVQHPMHLGTIKDNISKGSYKTSHDLTKDVKLILTNSRLYNREDHPITQSAEQLFATYLLEMSKAMDPLMQTSAHTSQPPPPYFPCPTCHIAICTSCRQIEHSGKPCSTADADHEMAMLAQFGYKRCPRCKAGQY